MTPGLESGHGEGGSGGVRRKEDTQDIGHTKGDEFLVGIGLVIVLTTERWRDVRWEGMTDKKFNHLHFPIAM